TEERSLLSVLDTVFASQEAATELEQSKLRSRRAIYASQYLTLANKYFGSNLNKDARRCYWKALCEKPSILISTDMSRRFLATLIGRGLYDRAKLLAKPSALAGH
ncbi:MAG TPA: hypothetical protein VFG11_07315, partial [Acidobacteriota bacterium]|nr:hypothetical protein [Acidobacteriota bacterium]